jgi:glutamate racemase
MTSHAPIGLFDSGVGGLTVLSALSKALPNEDFVYLGDTARVPYGSKSSNTVVRYAENNAHTLMAQHNLKMLVIACNTASAVALKPLQEQLDIPVLGVIQPGAQAALENEPKSIAVLGTRGTLNAGAYDVELQKLGYGGKIIHQACPLFVPLAEEGWVSGPITEKIAETYLEPLIKQCDAFILGCTHYPLFLPFLKKHWPQTNFIDSAASTAQHVKQELQNRHLLNPKTKKPSYLFRVTDHPDNFLRLAKHFLSFPISPEDVAHLEVMPRP